MNRVCFGLFAGTLLAFAPHPIRAMEPRERVALLISDVKSPEGTCHIKDIATTLKSLRFEVRTIPGTTAPADVVSFAKSSAGAEAAIIYACNPASRDHLPGALKASKLNFLFLLETAPAAQGAPIVNPLKTARDDLMIVHARIATPESDEIFSRTLSQKLTRAYSTPSEIMSRTITSAYYESRGTILIEVQGNIASSYLLTRPPTEKILDAWARVQNSNDRQALEEFIAQFPTTLFADLARSRLEKLP